MKFWIVFGLLFVAKVLSAQSLDTANILNRSQKIILPPKLEETSGLILFRGLTATINDSGGEPEVYLFDSTGKVVQTIRIKNGINRDWEAIATDGKRIFVGDFGNNLHEQYGRRTDLVIYAFDVPISKDTFLEVVADSIPIFYDYPKADETPKKTNFDCESMVCVDGTLHLFGKQWGDQKSIHYTLSTQCKSQKMNPLDTLNVGCLITDVTYVEGAFYAVAYNTDWEGFLLKISRDKNGKWTKFQKLDLGATEKIGQIEGIVYDPIRKTLHISGEALRKHSINLDQVWYRNVPLPN